MFQDSDDAFPAHKRQRKQYNGSDANFVSNFKIITFVSVFNFYIPQEHLVNPEIPKNDLAKNVYEVTISLDEFQNYEKIAEDCKVFEQKIKDYERIVDEMKRNEKKNQSVSCIK